MWIPTQNEAVEMYARFLIARHGTAAARYARKTAEKLRSQDDLQGHAMWSRVADALDSKAVKRADVEKVMALSSR
jgi:hypothetical protein